VSATGVAQLVRGHWLKKGAVVLDVGTTVVQVNLLSIIKKTPASVKLGYRPRNTNLSLSHCSLLILI